MNVGICSVALEDSAAFAAMKFEAMLAYSVVVLLCIGKRFYKCGTLSLRGNR